jgi:hypothetical protein
MKLAISTSLNPKPSYGILYVLEIELEDITLIKIGVTCRKKVEERVTEILTSIWKRYRYFPRTYVARYKKVDCPYDKEKILHDHFIADLYVTEHMFSGYTEFFTVDVNEVKEVYDKLIKTGQISEDQV